jgi:hypothetical protein
MTLFLENLLFSGLAPRCVAALVSLLLVSLLLVPPLLVPLLLVRGGSPCPA